MKVAVVGLGSMGLNHFKILQSMKGVQVYGVDPISRLAEFKDVDELFSNVKIDFAVVATPTTTHSDVSLKFIERNIPTLIEKPVFKSSEEANLIIDRLTKNDCKVAVGHIERFNPVCQTLAKELKNKRILNCNTVRISPYPKRISDVGVKLDLAIHDIDLIKFLTKEKIITCFSSSSSTNGAREDTCSFFIDIGGRTTCNVLVSWMSPFRKRTIEVLTTDSYYKADLLNKAVSKTSSTKSGDHKTKQLKVRDENALEKQLKQFIKYVTIGELGDLATLQDGLEALKIVE